VKARPRGDRRDPMDLTQLLFAILGVAAVVLG
jgi:hypothetical protein